MAADPVDKELKPAHPEAAALQSSNLERPTDSGEDRIGSASEKGHNEGNEKEVGAGSNSQRPGLKTIRTNTSGATTATHATTTTTTGEPGKKSWHKRLNPLRWGSPPSVPDRRMESREYHAGFFSLLTFQWMSPLMTVSFIIIISLSISPLLTSKLRFYHLTSLIFYLSQGSTAPPV